MRGAADTLAAACLLTRVTAFSVAGAFDAECSFDLAFERAVVMNAAAQQNPGALMSVTGLLLAEL